MNLVNYLLIAYAWNVDMQEIYFATINIASGYVHFIVLLKMKIINTFAFSPKYPQVSIESIEIW